MDVELVSIVVDPESPVAAEVDSRGIRSLVALDEDKQVSNMYGALEASMHPGMKPGHTFVLVDKAGEMVWRWDWPGHGSPMYVDPDEVFQAVSSRLSVES